MVLEFVQAVRCDSHLVYSLLAQSWAEILDEQLEAKIVRFDKEVSDNPKTVGACTYITLLDDNPAGMFSWDPRKAPEIGIIGWNCVLPEYRGRGIGKSQVQEILRRFRESGFQKAAVTTSEHPFFAAARRMYLACGFVEQHRYPDTGDSKYRKIDYELRL